MIEIHADTRELIACANVLRQAGDKDEGVMVRAINHVGGTARTKVARTLAGITFGISALGSRPIDHDVLQLWNQHIGHGLGGFKETGL